MLYHQIKEENTKFAAKHHQEISDIFFETDGDCNAFLRANNLKKMICRDTYTISDIIAWANNHGKEPKGVIALNLTETVLKIMIKMLKL